jgi:hypothetical protein
MNEVSDAQCKEFDGYVQKWQRLLNLSDWRIERGRGRPRKVFADVTFNDEAMLATYRIGANFGSAEVSSDSLERTALHELVHVRLRKFSLAPTEANEHEIVNVLEKLLMESQR